MCDGSCDGFIGSFTQFERSDGLGAGAQTLVEAGREEPATATQGVRPDLVAYKLGSGLVMLGAGALYTVYGGNGYPVMAVLSAAAVIMRSAARMPLRELLTFTLSASESRRAGLSRSSRR